MNNYERIKNMNIEEMSEFLAEHIGCGSCCFTEICRADMECEDIIKQGLESEAENE